jgi:hypothetical protein
MDITIHVNFFKNWKITFRLPSLCGKEGCYILSTVCRQIFGVGSEVMQVDEINLM